MLFNMSVVCAKAVLTSLSSCFAQTEGKPLIELSH